MADEEKKDQPHLIPCRTCGSYFPEEDAVLKVYCSNICATRYVKCINCGRYFIKTKKDAPPLCSAECSVYYKEKIEMINKKHRQ